MNETIVVGYDGSDGAELALERAAGLAEVFDSTVIVVVVEQLVAAAASPISIGMGEVPVLPLEPMERGWSRELQIERAREVLDARGVRFEVDSPLGDAALELVDVAEARDADLIVVGSNESGLLERIFGGSVSGEVARKASCDVLVVHQKSATTG